MKSQNETIILNALHIAAELFDEYTKNPSLPPTLQAQFAKQAKDARGVAESIEAGDAI